MEQALQESGYTTTVADNGDEGLRELGSGEYDLAIVDVMLPGMDGFEVLRLARQKKVSTPVLMLTARAELDDRVKGLDLGADDYLAKPFKLAELLARARALMRRGASSYLQYGDLRMDPALRKVWRGERELFLSATEYTLLELLLRNAERPVPKDEILKVVWGDQEYRDANVVEVYISYLRNKLGRSGGRLIHTVRKEGYVLRTDPLNEA